MIYCYRNDDFANLSNCKSDVNRNFQPITTIAILPGDIRKLFFTGSTAFKVIEFHYVVIKYSYVIFVSNSLCKLCYSCTHDLIFSLDL